MPTERTFLLKIKGNKIREYTKRKICQKLFQGEISQDVLIFSPNGEWHPIRSTKGFRNLCQELNIKKNIQKKKDSSIKLDDFKRKKSNSNSKHLKKTPLKNKSYLDLVGQVAMAIISLIALLAVLILGPELYKKMFQ
jgi:hypothetical protein